MSSSFKKFDTSEALLNKFSKKILEKLSTGIDEKGYSTILVSGGNTPKALFQKLSLMEFPWEKVKVGLVDERWLEENHEHSNAKLVKDYLLQNKAKSAQFIPLYQENISSYDAQDFCSDLMKTEFFPCDVLILGMGDDAHTASLFPNKEELKEGLNLENENYCISMIPNDAPYSRMSLSLSAILKAQNIYLHIQGENKKEVYEKALKEENYLISPISAVLRNDLKDVKVYYNE